MAAPTSRAWSSTGSIASLRCSAMASAASSTCWTSSERPAISASSGSVQSISTTWTAINSAPFDAIPTTRRTSRSSLGPPLRATTARRNAGLSVSGIGGHDTTATLAGGSAGQAGGRRSVLPAIRDVGDHRVLATEDGGLEALGRLVVEEPVPPVAGHEFGEHDDRDRRLLVRRPSLVQDVEIGEDRRDDRPVRRLDDHQGHARDLALPASPQRVAGIV